MMLHPYLWGFFGMGIIIYREKEEPNQNKHRKMEFSNVKKCIFAICMNLLMIYEIGYQNYKGLIHRIRGSLECIILS